MGGFANADVGRLLHRGRETGEMLYRLIDGCQRQMALVSHLSVVSSRLLTQPVPQSGPHSRLVYWAIAHVDGLDPPGRGWCAWHKNSANGDACCVPTNRAMLSPLLEPIAHHFIAGNCVHFIPFGPSHCGLKHRPAPVIETANPTSVNHAFQRPIVPRVPISTARCY